MVAAIPLGAVPRQAHAVELVDFADPAGDAAGVEAPRRQPGAPLAQRRELRGAAAAERRGRGVVADAKRRHRFQKS
jgi:hypothetical protein